MMNLKWYRLILIGTTLVLTTSCSQFSLLASGSSIALSQNTFAKMYNTADFLTVISTKKSIKKHAYNSAKKAWTEVKEGKEYIYDTTINLFGNKH